MHSRGDAGIHSLRIGSKTRSEPGSGATPTGLPCDQVAARSARSIKQSDLARAKRLACGGRHRTAPCRVARMP